MRSPTAKTAYVLLAILAAAAAGYRSNAPPAPSIDVTPPGQAYPVVRVIDGDTIVITYNGHPTTVRLVGVDTPETVHPSKPIEHYGPEASTFLHNLLTGESVHLEIPTTGDTRDRYDRLLAYVYRHPDGLHVNDELIRQGYARAYTDYPFLRSDSFMQRQRAARAAGRGMWGPPTAAPPTAP